MTWIDLGNPIPRDVHEPYHPYNWLSQDIEFLTNPVSLELPSIDQVIAGRRSRRKFGILDQDRLAQFLWWSCRTMAVGHDQLGFPITQRPAPSAGAIHPVHLVLACQRQDWRHYDSDKHGLVRLGITADMVEGLWQTISQVLDPIDGTALLFVAEPGKTNSKYFYGESLIWRDAGALIGHMALVAEAMKLNFCPLGITGEPWLSMLDREGKLVGVGVALLGSRIDS